MILDQFGNPRYQQPMQSIEWLHREFDTVFASRAADDRVRDLRRSILENEPVIGTTIRVKLPRRFRHGVD